MDFNFSTANKIIFGDGAIQSLPDIVQGLGKNVLFIRGKEKPDPSILFSILKKANLNYANYSVYQEPDADTINSAVDLGREEKCDFVIGFGGGSVLDTGKAVAALLNNKGQLLDYLEVVGKGLPLKNPSKPFIAIPTTAGTGSEVTRNAVISVKEKNVKVSMRNAYLLPEVALVDPQFTYKIPKNITATTGMDAFTQVLEPYVSKNNNPMVDIFCQEGIRTASSYILRAYENGNDIEARIKMSWVSLLGGLSLANAKLGAVHGFAGPIGGMFSVPHGSVCASLLPSVFSINAQIVSDRKNNSQLISRFSDIARWVSGNEKANIAEGVEALRAIAEKLNIPKLSDFGIKKSDFREIIKKSKNSSSMKGNPIQLTDAEMEKILDLSY
jgi:alcohol dehydrogenase class IV